MVEDYIKLVKKSRIYSASHSGLSRFETKTKLRDCYYIRTYVIG